MSDLEPQSRYDVSRQMNLLPDMRVGWEEKLKYQHWLAELSSGGYLSSEEYEARMTWLTAAHTEAELKAAFIDLPRLPLAERYLSTINTPKKKKKKNLPVMLVFVAGYEFTLMIIGLITGQIPLIIVGAVLFTFLTIRITKEQKGKS